MSDVQATAKARLQRAVGAIHPRPTLCVVREGEGVELLLRDGAQRTVVLAFGPVDGVAGAVHRTPITGVDVVEGALEDSHRPWAEAALGALTALEADVGWAAHLARLHRRARRRQGG